MPRTSCRLILPAALLAAFAFSASAQVTTTIDFEDQTADYAQFLSNGGAIPNAYFADRGLDSSGTMWADKTTFNVFQTGFDASLSSAFEVGVYFKYTGTFGPGIHNTALGLTSGNADNRLGSTDGTDGNDLLFTLGNPSFSSGTAVIQGELRGDGTAIGVTTQGNLTAGWHYMSISADGASGGEFTNFRIASETFDDVTNTITGTVVERTFATLAHALASDTTTFGFVGGNWNANAISNFDDFTLTAVPEPSTYALLAGFATLGLVMLRRRIRN